MPWVKSARFGRTASYLASAANLFLALSRIPSRSVAGLAFVSPSAMISIAEGPASFNPSSA